MHCFEYSILSVAMVIKFFACPEHTTEVIEIILFGKTLCIAIRIEGKKCILLHRDLQETNNTKYGIIKTEYVFQIYSTYQFTIFIYFCQI